MKGCNSKVIHDHITIVKQTYDTYININSNNSYVSCREDRHRLLIDLIFRLWQWQQ